MLTNRNQIYILICKFIHTFMHIDRIYAWQEATQMLRVTHSTQPLGETYQVQMSAAPTQNRIPNTLVEEVEGRLNNFRVRKTN